MSKSNDEPQGLKPEIFAVKLMLKQLNNGGTSKFLETYISSNNKIQASIDGISTAVNPLIFAILPGTIELQFQNSQSDLTLEQFKKDYIKKIEQYADILKEQHPDRYKEFQLYRADPTAFLESSQSSYGFDSVQSRLHRKKQAAAKFPNFQQFDQSRDSSRSDLSDFIPQRLSPSRDSSSSDLKVFDLSQSRQNRDSASSDLYDRNSQESYQNRESSGSERNQDYLQKSSIRNSTSIRDSININDIITRDPSLVNVSQEEAILDAIRDGIRDNNWSFISNMLFNDTKLQIQSVKNNQVQYVNPLVFAILPSSIKQQFDGQDEKFSSVEAEHEAFKKFSGKYINAIKQYVGTIQHVYPDKCGEFLAQINESAKNSNLTSIFPDYAISSRESIKLEQTIRQITAAPRNEIKKSFEDLRTSLIQQPNITEEQRNSLINDKKFAERNSTQTLVLTEKNPAKTFKESFLEIVQKILKTFGIKSKFIETRINQISTTQRLEKQSLSFVERVSISKDRNTDILEK